MESSGSEDDGGRKGLRDELQQALDDLQSVAVDAGGAVRTQIDSAVEQIKGVTESAATKAQAGAGDLSSQLDGVREWIQNATGELVEEAQGALNELQKEIEKRRRQLGLGGSGGGSESSEGAESGSSDAD
jgi:hypothetical protein